MFLYRKNVLGYTRLSKRCYTSTKQGVKNFHVEEWVRKKLHEIQQGQTDVANSDCAFMGKTAQKNTWISDDYYISLQSELMILFLVCAGCG